MNDSTDLHRSIHPSHVRDGQPGSVCFVPNEADEFKLSVYNGEKMTPEEAFIHRTTNGGKSSGISSVSVLQCTSLDLRPVDDPKEFEGHALIHFPHDKKQCEKLGKKLKALARWTYTP